MVCVQGLARLQSCCSSLSCDSDRSSLVRRARRVLSCVPHVCGSQLRNECDPPVLLCTFMSSGFPGFVVLCGSPRGWRFAVSVACVVMVCQVVGGIVFC